MVDRLLRAALRSPTAGNTGGTAWVVLEGPRADGRATSTPPPTRPGGRANPEWSEGLRAGPGRAARLHLARRPTSPATPKPDKAAAGLGAGADAWPVPYWYGDAAFGVMTVLLGAVDAGLGACILGSFRGEDELADAARGPRRLAPLLRRRCSATPTATTTAPPRSTGPRPPRAERIHRGRW